MAVFLVRIETDFVEYYDAFFEAVRTGGSLEYIEDMRDEMVYSVRQGLAEIAKIQALALIVAVVLGPAALEALGISSLYLPLFYIQTLGASLQGTLHVVLLHGAYPSLDRSISIPPFTFVSSDAPETVAARALSAALEQLHGDLATRLAEAR